MSEGEIPAGRRAKPGYIWRCQACGKTAEDRWGLIGRASFGYDESCMLHAVEVPIEEGFTL